VSYNHGLILGAVTRLLGTKSSNPKGGGKLRKNDLSFDGKENLLTERYLGFVSKVPIRA